MCSFWQSRNQNLNKHFYLVIIFSIIFSKVYGQDISTNDNKMVCTIDGTPVMEKTIRSQLIDLSFTDQLNTYFNQVKDTLVKDEERERKIYKDFYANYCIKNITQSAT